MKCIQNYHKVDKDLNLGNDGRYERNTKTVGYRGNDNFAKSKQNSDRTRNKNEMWDRNKTVDEKHTNTINIQKEKARDLSPNRSRIIRRSRKRWSDNLN